MLINGLDEKELRRRAREALKAGLIPRDRPRSLWGGNGAGHQCPVCGRAIEVSEIELEVEFEIAEVCLQGVREFHLHLPCFAAWEFARSAVD